MGWTERNLRGQFAVPPGVFVPSAYDFPDQGTRHVVYLGGTGQSDATGVLHELYSGADGVWHEKDLLAESGGPPSATAPEAYVFVLEGTQHVLYTSTAGDGHLRELWWDGSWHPNDLTSDSGGTSARRFVGFESRAARAQVVVVQGLDSHVHALTRKSADDGDPRWVAHDLTAEHGGPLCQRGAGGYASSAGVHVNFLGIDGRVYEYIGDQRLTWTDAVDIGAGLAGPTGFAANTFRGFASVDGTRHLPVVDDAGHLWIYTFTDHWSVVDLAESIGAAPVAAGTFASPYVFGSTPAVPVATDHVVYVGADSLIHEAWWDPTGWHENALTGAGSPPAAGGAVGFAELATSSQHVFYLSTGNEVVELVWTAGRDRRWADGTAVPMQPLAGR